MSKCKYKQGSPEWVEWRSMKIGGSDVAAVMGLNPWCSPRELYQRKLGINPVVVTENMKQGTLNEKIAFDKFLEQVAPEEYWIYQPNSYIHEKYEYIQASLDGVRCDEKVSVEIKVGRGAYKASLNGVVPEYYYAQIQHQIEVCDLEKSYFYCMFGEKVNVIPVFRDEKFIERMIDLELKFYSCLINLVEPNYIDYPPTEWD